MCRCGCDSGSGVAAAVDCTVQCHAMSLDLRQISRVLSSHAVLDTHLARDDATAAHSPVLEVT